MGRPRFLPTCLIAALVSLAACETGDDDLLAAGRIDGIYSGGGGGGNYGPSGSGAGTIVGKVTFQGRGWPHKQLDITTVDGFCIRANAPGGLMAEDFLVGPDGALQNVVVWVKRGLEAERYDPPSEPLVFDQRNCQYHPHVAVLQHGQTLIIKSSDNTNHNVHMLPGANPELNRSMTRPGQLEPMTFRKTEIRRVFCDVHGWMVSWLAILPHPCHAITAKDGTFKIENVPAGTYQLGAWHEKKKLAEQTRDVTVKPGETVTIDFVFERE